METRVIDKIEVGFAASRSRYAKLSAKFQTDFIYDFRAEYDRFFNDLVEGLPRLVTTFNTFKRQATFRKEINLNIKAKEVGYFNFLNNTFGNQYTFISSFKEALDAFFNDNDNSWHIVENLDSGLKCDKSQFILAIQLYYIFIYDSMEQYVAEQYAGYQIKLSRPTIKKIAARNINKRIVLFPFDDDKLIKELHAQLTKNSFIDEKTQYKSFKHILIQRNIVSKDKIVWTDIADSKWVNKITLLDFVSLLVNGDSEMQNDFIVKYCATSNSTEGYVEITRESINNSRRDFKKDATKNDRRIVVKSLVYSLIGSPKVQ